MPQSPIRYEDDGDELVVKIEDWLYDPLMEYMRWVPLLDSLDVELNLPQKMDEILSFLTDLSLVKTDLVEVNLSLMVAAYAVAKIMMRKTVRFVRVVLLSGRAEDNGTASASLTVE